MDIAKKTRNASGFRQEEQDRRVLSCHADYLPGRALESWWIYDSVSSNNRRDSYRYSHHSHHDLDGCLTTPGRGAIRARNGDLRSLRAGGIYLNFLNWRGYRSGGQLMICLGWCGSWRCGSMGSRLGHRLLH